MIEYTPQQSIEAATTCLRAEHPNGGSIMPILLGSPGSGKTTICKQIADNIGLELNVLQVLCWDYCDSNGIPHVVDGFTQFVPPKTFFPEKPTLIVLDEFGQLPAKMKQLFMQPVIERVVAGKRIPDHVHFLATANRKEDRAGVESFPTNIRNRMAWISVRIDAGEWVGWAHQAGVRPEVISAVSAHPELLDGFDPSSPGMAFSTPRSIEYLSRVLDASKGSKPKATQALAASIVGQEAAAKFIAHIKYQAEILTPEECFEKPEEASSSELGAIHAMITSCVSFVARDKKVSRAKLDKFVGFVEALSPALGIAAIQQLKAARPEAMRNKSVLGFAKKNLDILT